MRFTPQFLDELKARLPVSEVVGKRVKLVRSGREFKGLSPFNKEKTASFFVNDQKQAWFDFSSGKNGSIFDFVMESEGVSFPERRTKGYWPISEGCSGASVSRRLRLPRLGTIGIDERPRSPRRLWKLSGWGNRSGHAAWKKVNVPMTVWVRLLVPA